jgi:transposase-like protein
MGFHNRYSVEDRARYLSDYSKSNLSVKEFSKLHGISTTFMYSLLRGSQLNSSSTTTTSQAAKFIELNNAKSSEPTLSSSQVEIRLPNGAVVIGV